MLDLLDHPAADEPIADWLARLAGHLLNGCALMVSGQSYRLLEIEAYLLAPSWQHADPFTHADEMQLTTRRWYFHRECGSYRGGSFKGVDVTFGDAPDAHGGWLVRSIERPDGTVVNGCSLCVDEILNQTGHYQVADLDAALATHRLDSSDSPLQLAPAAAASARRPVWASARVGLTLKRVEQHPRMAEFIGRPYRFMTRPDRLPKGRPQLVIALHEAGHSVDAIVQIAGGQPQKVAEWIGRYEVGRAAADLAAWFGKPLDPGDTCQMLGAWRQTHG